MSVERITCDRCHGLIGAVNTETGESEYVKGARIYETAAYCRECYNETELADVPFLGGFGDDEEDLLYEE